jgi:hypothetical protein
MDPKRLRDFVAAARLSFDNCEFTREEQLEIYAGLYNEVLLELELDNYPMYLFATAPGMN